jgi:hypothetical protein
MIDNLYTGEQSPKTPWPAIRVLHQTLFSQVQKHRCRKMMPVSYLIKNCIRRKILFNRRLIFIVAFFFS